jgi:hypothetical protein
VAVAVVGAAILLTRGPDGRPDDPVRDGDAPPSTSVDIPPDLRLVLDDRTPSLMFVTREPTRSPDRFRHRGWRLELASGVLIPGPNIGPPRLVRSAPDGEELAYLTEGGSVYAVGDFFGERPRWLALGVDAFDLLPGGRIVMARLAAGPAADDGSAPTVLRVTSAEYRGEELADITTDVHEAEGFEPRGVRVTGNHVSVWGDWAGGAAVWEAEAPPHRGASSGGSAGASVSGVGPGSVLDVGPREGMAIEWSPSQILVEGTDWPEPRPFRRGSIFRRVLAWSDDGSTVAIAGEGRLGERGVWVAGPSLSRWIGGAAPSGGTFDPFGNLFVWVQPGAIHVLELSTGRVHRIPLPADVPEPAGPLVIR